MEKGLLKKITEQMKSVKIAIVGDFCLDAYWFIDTSKSEISIETGRPTQPVGEQKYSPGGAGNVANNLAAMKVGEILAFGVTGNDPFGTEMISIMKRRGINTSNMVVQNENWSTHVYIKPHIEEEEQDRIDFGNCNVLSDETADRLIQNLKRETALIDLVIINQQVLSGIHTGYFREKLVEVISLFPQKIFITDSRDYNDYYKGSYRKMNDTEALRLCRIIADPGEKVSYTEVTRAANKLFERYLKPIFITCGNRGSIVIDENGISDIPGLMTVSKVDTVGAGDSYLAGTAAALAAGFPLKEAAETGNFVAGVTVQKLFQTGTASPEEILRIGSDPDYIYNPVLAEDIRQAGYLENSEIEIINCIPSDLNIRYAIFDNDGTISTLREGWEQVMAPMMVKAILGHRYADAGSSLISKVKVSVDEMIDKTTGIQTLMQMKMLLELIKEFGFVPENQILDEHGYKKIYNEMLMEIVGKREKKLINGELECNDLTMKNVLPFLKILYDKGIKLFLTSGTDEEDVKHEASVLGYDHLFEGRIYGATGNINKEVKKAVLDHIIESIGTSEAGSIATFGDGPVEIRETHKHGGLTIGIASNELRRNGLNEVKRTRLIKAGADIIVPDFSQSEILLKLLNVR